MAGRRLVGSAGLLGVAVLCAALVSVPSSRAQGPPGFAQSLCPRAQAPDPDCYTISIPAEVWAVATTLRIKPTRQAKRAYDSLIPEPFFPIPGRRRVAVLMFRLNTQMSPGSDANTDPGPGYAEGSVAIRVGFPARDGYPYRVGWWDLAQPLNDPSQYDAGRDIGLPKYMARAGLRIADGRWRAHATRWGRTGGGQPGAATVRRGNILRISWSGKKPRRLGRRRARAIRTWGRY